MDTENSTYTYDIKVKELLNDCKLAPSTCLQSEHYWLYAVNNKYTADEVDPNKVGKWMLFIARAHVDSVWDKIKKAIREGDLWHSKVSTVDASSKSKTHAIMIYTRDYTNIPDVISVLDFLESSGIKALNSTIRYKTDQQTYAGIYSGGTQKASIYDSNTIRNKC